MDKDELRYEDLLEIVRLFESSSEFSELHLKYGSTELNLRKHGAEGPGLAPTPATTAVNMSPPPSAKPAVPAPPAPPPPVLATERAAPVPPNAFEIKSPTVGTFYGAPAPGATPFVTVGQRVEPHTTVCIIEVMKLMNSIQANCHGIVSQMLVNDGEPVEFGQTLIVIEQD